MIGTLGLVASARRRVAAVVTPKVALRSAPVSSAYNVPSATQSVTVSVVAGDLIVVCAAAEDSTCVLHTPSAPGNVFTVRQSVSPASNSPVAIWTAVAAATDASLPVSVSITGYTPARFGFTVFVFSSHGGTGGSGHGSGTGTPSVAVTTTGANSMLVTVSADWSQNTGARAWSAVNVPATEDVYATDAGIYTVYIAHYTDTGAAGVKTLGLTSPAGQTYTIVSLEILGM